MVRTQIQLTKEQAERIHRLAHQRGLSMAEIVREAVDAYTARILTQDEMWERAMAFTMKYGSGSGANDVAENHDRYLDEIYGH